MTIPALLLEKDATWTVGVSSAGTIDVVIGSAAGGHRCTLRLGYNQAQQLTRQLSVVLSLCKPASPTEAA